MPVYHPPGIRPQIDAQPPWRAALSVTNGWADFVAHGERAVCEVLIVPDLEAWELWENFVEHQKRESLTPRILVTTPAPENLRRTIGVVLHDVVWLDASLRIDLTEAITRASTEGLLFRCSAVFAGADGLPRELRDAFVTACQCRPAVREVNHLARLARKDRRTISTDWTDFAGPAPALRLKQVLDLIVLLRVIRRRHLGERWSPIVRELGLNTDVLRRQAEARLGKSLSDLTVEDANQIVGLLESLASHGRRPGGDPDSTEDSRSAG